MTRPLHVVQIGWDTTALVESAASDTRERQRLYGEILAAARPGSRHTVIVLGAPPGGPVALDATTDVIPLARRWRSLAELARVLRRLHAERPIAVVATQTIMEDAWAALRFTKAHRVPLVAQLHLDPFAGQALSGRGPLRRLAAEARITLALRRLASYAGVRVVAAELGKRLKECGARQIWTIPVPVTDLAALGALPLEPRSSRVLFVGRLAPEKNLPLWLDVAARIQAARPDAGFDIVGDGPLRATLEARAQDLGLAGRLVFHGALDREALPAIFGRAGVFLLTSSQEGFGRVLVEAMAAGVAVVSTRTAGALEAAGRHGRLVDLTDTEGLAQNVLALLANPSERATTAAAARADVLQRYDPATLARAWMDVLTGVADQASESRPG